MAAEDDRDLRFMNEALEEARQALAEGEVPIGAVLVSPDGDVVSREHNRSLRLNDPTAHAEILALRRGADLERNYRLTGTTLYVTVEPCLMCAGALIWARVGRLVYGARDAKAGAVDSLYRILHDARLNHVVAVTGGVAESRCREIMQGFFSGRRAGTAPGAKKKERDTGEVPKRS